MNDLVIDPSTLRKAQLRHEIMKLVDEYAALQFAPKEFEPGITTIPPSGKVLGAAELRNMVDASLDAWLTTGRFNDQFEARLAKFLGVKFRLFRELRFVGKPRRFLGADLAQAR